MESALPPCCAKLSKLRLGVRCNRLRRRALVEQVQRIGGVVHVVETLPRDRNQSK
jgi:hypothetical protein